MIINSNFFLIFSLLSLGFICGYVFTLFAFPIDKEIITKEQFTNLIKYLCDTSTHGSFRYLIYDVMKFKSKDYMWLYETGLFHFNNDFKIILDLEEGDYIETLKENKGEDSNGFCTIQKNSKT